ncbi:MAG: hypothetical protein DDT27_01497 [Dehalococcoidia bacterium]|nr:hypothetical protein [Chloroflexota bacterium]MBT9162932.1 hypothetical protein [Chloroflexota bacterium]
MVNEQAHMLLVSRARITGDLRSDVARAVEVIGGWEWLSGAETVLVKPNYNSAHPPPGSTATDFLRAVLLLLREHGAEKLIVGESTSQLNHRKVMEQAGVFHVTQELDVPVVVFDEDGWENVTVGGQYLKRVKLTRTLRRVDRVVYLCCPKAHHAAQFTGSLKLGMGFVSNWRRTLWHFRHLQEKIADLNLVLKPDLIVADMRRTFIAGGPATGELREPDLLLASRNRVAIDVEAIRIIQSFPGHSLPDEAGTVTQIARATELGLGPGEGMTYQSVEV